LVALRVSALPKSAAVLEKSRNQLPSSGQS